MRALEHVFSEICADSSETMELLQKDLSALQARLDVHLAQEASLLERSEVIGGLEESSGEGNMLLVAADADTRKESILKVCFG
jgi:hypothetical protein